MANDEADKKPETQTQSDGCGGGKKVITALGLGDSGGGGSINPSDRSQPGLPGGKAQIKDIAINALSSSRTQEFPEVRDLIHKGLVKRFDDSNEMLSEVTELLACLVVSASVVAQFSPKEQAGTQLRCMLPGFTEDQIVWRQLDLTSATTRISG